MQPLSKHSAARIRMKQGLAAVASIALCCCATPSPAGPIGTGTSTPPTGATSMTPPGTTTTTIPCTPPCTGKVIYDPPMGDLSGPQSALVMFMNVMTNQTPFRNEGNGNFQQRGYSGSIEFMRTTPAMEGNGNRTNLITADFSGALLSGMPGSMTLDLTASQNFGDPLHLSSDFITNFGLATFESMDFQFNLLKPLMDPSDLANFVATSFSATWTMNPDPQFVPAVPEPATLVLAGIAMMGLVGWRRFR